MHKKILPFKDKEFSIELKPVFQTIVQNAYNLRMKNANNRTLESGYSTGLDTDSDPKNEKYSRWHSQFELGRY